MDPFLTSSNIQNRNVKRFDVDQFTQTTAKKVKSGVVTRINWTDVDAYLESKNLRRKLHRVYNPSNQIVGYIRQVKWTPRVIRQSYSDKGRERLPSAQRLNSNNSGVVSIVFKKRLRQIDVCANINIKPRHDFSLEKNLDATTKNNTVIMDFANFPPDVKNRVNIAHNIALITRLKNEPFEKVAKSCLPDDDAYLASFSGADRETLESELKRLRGLRRDS